MSLCLMNVHGDIEGDYEFICDIPKGTNGEVIKALFPNYDYEDKTEYFGRIRNMDDHFIKADIDFWNSPYQKRW